MIIYMPMVPEAVVAMLACARLGAVHSVVFGGFAANELATRIDDATPKAIVSASCGIEPGRLVAYKPLLDAAIELAAHKPERCIILQRPMLEAELVPGRDVDWDDAVAGAEPAGCVAVEATDPLYILYTSGTTGQPKGIVRDNGGHAVALAWTMSNIYDVEPGRGVLGGVRHRLGRRPLVHRLRAAPARLHDGPLRGQAGRHARRGRVLARDRRARGRDALHGADRVPRDPPAGPGRRADRRLRPLAGSATLFLAGERCDPETLGWAEQKLGVPVIDHWWQTETGWAIAANCLGIERLPVKPGSPTKAVPGWDVRVLGDDGGEAAPGEIGALVVKLPLPPGASPTLWNADERFREAYLSAFPGYYQTADAGFIDEDGYVFVMARTDDIINVAGHRLSTGAMEEVLASHPDVAECAVIGVADELKGQVPVGFLVLKAGVERAARRDRRRRSWRSCASGSVRSPRSRPRSSSTRLPKTRSGKILRGTMRRIADSEEYTIPATIDDPAILDEIAVALAGVGYAGG